MADVRLRHLISAVSALILAAALISCSPSANGGGSETDASPDAAGEPRQTADVTESTDSTEETIPIVSETDEVKDMTISITVGGESFTASLFDTDAAREFYSRLPLTLEMSELNGNEKYFYLDEGLTKDSCVPDLIHTGDLMLYGSSCIVIFYKDFVTSYSYTPLGHIDSSDGQKLADALGSGSVTVTFER